MLLPLAEPLGLAVKVQGDDLQRLALLVLGDLQISVGLRPIIGIQPVEQQHNVCILFQLPRLPQVGHGGLHLRPILGRSGQLGQPHHGDAVLIGQGVQGHGGLGHLLVPGRPGVLRLEQLDVVDVNNLIVFRLGQVHDLGCGSASGGQNIQVPVIHRLTVVGHCLPVLIAELVPLNALHRQTAHHGHLPVKQLVRTSLQRKEPHPILLTLCPGEGQCQGGLTVTGITAKDDEIPQLRIQAHIQLFQPPRQVLDRLLCVMPLIEPPQQILLGERLLVAAHRQRLTDTGRRLPGGVTGLALRQRQPKPPQAAELRLFQQDVHVRLAVGRRRRQVQQVQHQLPVFSGVPVHLLQHRHRINGGAILGQLLDG